MGEESFAEERDGGPLRALMQNPSPDRPADVGTFERPKERKNEPKERGNRVGA